MKFIFVSETHALNTDYVVEMFVSGVRFDGKEMKWSLTCVMANGSKIGSELPECNTKEKAEGELKRLADGLNRR